MFRAEDLALLLLCGVFTVQCSSSASASTWSGDGEGDARIFAAYYANWAQDRYKPYTFLPEDLGAIVGRLDYLVYAFAHFDPNNFQIVLTHQNDSDSIARIMKYKWTHPELKILISIGGDKFPSANFSRMVSSNATRKRFISRLKHFVSAHGFDGVDINWQRPCSSAKVIYDNKKKACSSFRAFNDTGGKCPEDADNLVMFLKHLRRKLNDADIFFSGSPLEEDYKRLHLSAMSRYIDYWNIGTYDYTVSATASSNFTAPNAPLMTPKSQTVITTQSINSTGI